MRLLLGVSRVLRSSGNWQIGFKFIESLVNFMTSYVCLACDLSHGDNVQKIRCVCSVGFRGLISLIGVSLPDIGCIVSIQACTHLLSSQLTTLFWMIGLLPSTSKCVWRVPCCLRTFCVQKTWCGCGVVPWIGSQLHRCIVLCFRRRSSSRLLDILSCFLGIFHP